MKEFSIVLPNEIGRLAWLTEEFSIRSINIITITATEPKSPVIDLIPDNVERTEQLLKELNLEYSVQDLLVVRLNDKPGELANCCRLLADESIDIESVYMVGKVGRTVKLALRINDMEKARLILENYMD